MNADDAAALLPLHRPGRPVEGRLQRAVRFAEKDGALGALLASQREFDGRMVQVLSSISPPENLRQKLREAGAREATAKPKLRTHAFNPAVLTALLGGLLILGFLAWTVLERLERFAGREAAERMLTTTSKMSGVELDPVATTPGAMEDWFYMRGFEGFAVPPELASLPVVGSRVFRIDGHAIAQLAVDRQDSMLYVFRASDFGVEIPADQPWRLMEHSGWVAALRRHGDICSMLAFRGVKPDMRKLLDELKAP